MTVHAALDEFTALAATVPLPAARLRLPAAGVASLDSEWNAARKAFDQQLVIWRSGFISHLGMMRAQLEQAVGEVGAELVGKMAVELLAPFRETLEEAIMRTRSQAELEPAVANRLATAATLSGQAGKLARKYRKQYREAMQRRLDFLMDASDRLLALELDFDPETRTGKAFTNIDDLLADLRAE